MIRLKIAGMTCGHCKQTVEDVLSKLPGVRQVREVSLERGEALIAGEPDVAAVIAALRAEGYEARVA